jgi:hypothetical protein
MTTNKYPGTCEICGEHVPADKGEIRQVWDGQEDEFVWKVRHTDTGICQSVRGQETAASECERGYHAIIGYIKEYGQKTNDAVYGNEVVIDRRYGINQVGWVVTVDNKNTIRLTEKSWSDGYDLSETYTLTDNGDNDGYGNGNDDIKSALHSITNGVQVSIRPFAI